MVCCAMPYLTGWQDDSSGWGGHPLDSPHMRGPGDRQRGAVEREHDREREHEGRHREGLDRGRDPSHGRGGRDARDREGDGRGDRGGGSKLLSARHGAAVGAGAAAGGSKGSISQVSVAEQKRQRQVGTRLQQLLQGLTVPESLAGPEAHRTLTSLLAKGEGGGVHRPKITRASERIAAVQGGRLRGALLASVLLPGDDVPPPAPAAVSAASIASTEAGKAVHAQILSLCSARMEALASQPWARRSKVGGFMLDATQQEYF